MSCENAEMTRNTCQQLIKSYILMHIVYTKFKAQLWDVYLALENDCHIWFKVIVRGQASVNNTGRPQDLGCSF